MPASIQASFQGTAQAFRASLTNEPLLILAAIITVYIVLGVLYESYIHPLTILSTLPSAGVGAILALLIFRLELTVVAIIGIILLIGIVKKNAIMMIDFALEAERSHGKSPEEAIYQDDGGSVRCFAIGVWLRNRCGATTPTRHHTRWRSHAEPTADVVHNPSDLSLL